MIILDTNLLSALMQTKPDSAVITWLDSEPAESIWITSITIFETHFGLNLLPEGEKRKSLAILFANIVEKDLENRIFLFDRKASEQAAHLAAARQNRKRKKIGDRPRFMGK